MLNLAAVVAVVVGLEICLASRLHSVGPAIIAAGCILAYIAGTKFIERRQPFELALKRALPEFFAGLALGFLLFSVVMAVLFLLHVYQPVGWGSVRRLGSGFLFAVLAGVTEEIVFRGLLFRVSAKIIGTWGALIATSALFGAAHASNPGATFASSLAIALEAGILLGAAYAATQRLWVPIGLHVGWNFTEGSIFSMNISGTGIHEGLVRGSLSGPRSLTGGEFGPEASVVAVILCMVAAIWFLWRIIKLHRAEPPIFGKRQSEVPAPA